MKPRLFIGNLPPSVTEEELREKFESLLSSHKNEAQVGDVQVRCKNENNYFGFVDVHIEDNDTTLSMQNQTGMNSIPLFLRKSIDLMNNTKWKGSLIKVQLAKESFIEKLRREQEGRKEEAKKPNEDDLNTEQGRNKKQADDILYKLNKSKERRNRTEFHRQFPTQETVNITEHRDCGFEVVNSKNLNNKKVAPTGTFLEKRKIKQKQAKKRSSSEDDSDEEDQVRDGIPKFKGILVNFPQASFSEKTELKQPAATPLYLACDIPPPPVSNDKMELSGLNFKKNKQQRSDLLRLKSLEKLEELKTQRKNIIKSSLSTVTAVAPLNDQHKAIESENLGEEPSNKRQKMTLFDGDDDEDSNEIGNSESEFAVKKQFEGASGQKLLELKTRWGNDDRFKIDDRFKEANDNEEYTIEPAEQEKEKQLNILTDIFGKSVTSLSSSGHATGKTNSVILPRYDPEADVDETRDHEEQSKTKTATSIKISDKNKESPAAAGQLIRSTEPATFKTVSNLKTLFSSGENATDQKTSIATAEKETSFSLLATFGNVNDDNMKIEEETNAASSSIGVPRSFWQSNPFKYDSSDDEDEGKVNEKLEKTEKSSKAPLVVHGKQSFFFKVNDPRLQGVEDYFLKPDEVLEENAEKSEKKEVDFAEKRQELKSIVKAKIRNSKRKDEKRTLAIKRAIRKRKRKLHKGHRLNGYPTRRTTTA